MDEKTKALFGDFIEALAVDRHIAQTALDWLNDNNSERAKEALNVIPYQQRYEELVARYWALALTPGSPAPGFFRKMSFKINSLRNRRGSSA